MNVIFRERILEMPLSYNAATSLFADNWIRSYLNNSPSFQEAISDPRVVHFSRSIKPWHTESTHPFKNTYWECLKETPWKHRKMERVKKRAKNILWPFLRRLAVRVFETHKKTYVSTDRLLEKILYQDKEKKDAYHPFFPSFLMETFHKHLSDRPIPKGVEKHPDPKGLSILTYDTHSPLFGTNLSHPFKHCFIKTSPFYPILNGLL